MSRITVNTKCRLCRAAGIKLYLKGARCLSSKCPLEKKGAVPPGMHGIKRLKKPSDYGIQLKAKQKAKRIYGVQETQFKNYYTQAKKLTGLMGNNLLTLLEKRLDNVVYQSGLSLSRANARQLVSHRHVLVNGKVLNIASHHLKNNDVVSLDKITISQLGDILRVSDKDFKSPPWLDSNKNKYTVSVVADPSPEDFNQGIDVNLIIEYYSR
jgi:small subunit ribosomal protein S4